MQNKERTTDNHTNELDMFFSSSDRRLRMAKKRRRQHLLAVGVLMVVAGGFLKSRVEPPTVRSVKARRLLASGLQPPSWSLLMV